MVGGDVTVAWMNHKYAQIQHSSREWDLSCNMLQVW